MDGIFSTIKISGSGMSAQRRKMDVVAENIANAETTSTKEGGPYRRRYLEIKAETEKVPFKTILERSSTGLARTHSNHMTMTSSSRSGYEKVSTAHSKISVGGEEDVRLVYEPSHPDADDEGYVKMPNIEIINEMVDMMSANRAYEANALAISASKEMIKTALDI